MTYSAAKLGKESVSRVATYGGPEFARTRPFLDYVRLRYRKQAHGYYYS